MKSISDPVTLIKKRKITARAQSHFRWRSRWLAHSLCSLLNTGTWGAHTYCKPTGMHTQRDCMLCVCVCVCAEHERKLLLVCDWVELLRSPLQHRHKHTGKRNNKYLGFFSQVFLRRHIKHHLHPPYSHSDTLTGFWKSCDYNTQQDKTHTARAPLHTSPKKTTQTQSCICGRKLASPKLVPYVF